MKRLFVYAAALVLFSAPAFAGTNSQSVNIPSAVSVGSTQLPAGSYKISWTGSGSNVQVTLTKGGKTVATSAATVVEGRNIYAGVTTQTQGGANVLQTIQLDNVSLILSGAPTTAAVTSGH